MVREGGDKMPGAAGKGARGSMTVTDDRKEGLIRLGACYMSWRVTK